MDAPAHLTWLITLKHNDSMVTMGLAALSCEAVTKAARRGIKAGFLTSVKSQECKSHTCLPKRGTKVSRSSQERLLVTHPEFGMKSCFI